MYSSIRWSGTLKHMANSDVGQWVQTDVALSSIKCMLWNALQGNSWDTHLQAQSMGSQGGPLLCSVKCAPWEFSCRGFQGLFHTTEQRNLMCFPRLGPGTLGFCPAGLNLKSQEWQRPSPAGQQPEATSVPDIWIPWPKWHLCVANSSLQLQKYFNKITIYIRVTR